jgi:hypothetical protein
LSRLGEKMPDRNPTLTIIHLQSKLVSARVCGGGGILELN